jgi:hypothetical protein
VKEKHVRVRMNDSLANLASVQHCSMDVKKTLLYDFGGFYT